MARLNPFAFPSDTDFRFVLLIVAVLGTSLFFYNGLWFAAPGNAEYFRGTYARCLAAADVAHPITTPSDTAAMAAHAAAVSECAAGANVASALWMLAGAALVLLVAGAIYWLYPLWKIGRDHLVPLTEEDAPEVVESLAELVREAGLKQPPTFVWNPLNMASGGLAFGRLGRTYVSLTGGLVTQFYTAPPAFRAVVLHELAHLRNADVDKTYFTVAIWRAFLAVALAPYAVWLVFRAPGDIFKYGWRLVALTGLVFLTRNAVLRAREVYADLRASVWDGPQGGLGRVLAALPRRVERRWRAVWQVHPDPAVRRSALEDTSGLFRLGLWDAFGAGMAATIAFPTVVHLLGLLTRNSNLAIIGPGILFAPLAVGVVGLGVWRETFARLARGERPKRAGRLGLALGLGVIAGQTLSLQTALTGTVTTGTATPVGHVVTLAFDVLWALLLLGSLALLFRWIAAGAEAWLPTAATARSPRGVYVVGLSLAGALLGLWLGMLLFGRSLNDSLSGKGPLAAAVVQTLTFLGIETVYVLVQPLTLVALVVLWAFPLAAALARPSDEARAPAWAFLDRQGAWSWPSARRFDLRGALWGGLIAGVVYALGLALLGVVLWLTMPDAVKHSDSLYGTVKSGQFAVAVLLQAIVAGIVAARGRWLRVAHAQLAQFVAGCIMLLAVLGLNLALGWGLSAGLVQTASLIILNGGTLLALPVAMGVAAVVGRRGHALRAEPVRAA